MLPLVVALSVVEAVKAPVRLLPDSLAVRLSNALLVAVSVVIPALSWLSVLLASLAVLL